MNRQLTAVVFLALVAFIAAALGIQVLGRQSEGDGFVRGIPPYQDPPDEPRALLPPPQTPPAELRAVLLSAASATDAELERARAEGANAIVLKLEALDREGAEEEWSAAFFRIRNRFVLYYWIEIGRDVALADERPELMASLQGHDAWRRLFPGFPQPRDEELVRVWPWVPVLHADAFDAHEKRVGRLLGGKPRAAGVFLNGLQSGPSACGCGNLQCRWTTGYGPRRAALATRGDAAATFVRRVRSFVVQWPDSVVIPVWVPECGQRDIDDRCAGVGCYEGRCWSAWTEQLMPLAEAAPQIAVLSPYEDFSQDLDSFAREPSRFGGTGIPARRLIAIIQGWDVSTEQLTARIERVLEAGASGYIIARKPIDQSWEPRIVESAKGAPR